MKKILFSLLMLCCMTAAWAEGTDGFIEVDTTEKLWNAIKKDASAKVRLTADFALSDINKDYEIYCETFSGTIDGNGHTIKGDPGVDVRARTYMFYNCSGATIKNLTFKGIRVNSQKNPNQAIITAKAQNHCVFENITLDNVHTFSDYDNAGGVAGWAQDCTFTNITVKNSDFTTDATQSGAVVAHAINCTFTNIKVENCESTTDDGKSGGVAGRTDDCTISNVEILGCFIKSYEVDAGGITGKSVKSHYSNCIIDDQSCVYAYHPGPGSGWHSRLGGIVGNSDLDVIKNCINSALICGHGEEVGGIVGYVGNDDGGEITIENCLNTGMIISMNINDLTGNNGYYTKYKNKTLPCVTKYYNGKEYIVRKTDINYTSLYGYSYYGGILGSTHNCTISKCANIGSMSDQGDKTGGIVGWCKYAATLSDCLSAFESPKDNIKGFIGVVFIEGCKITNCMSTKTAKDYEEESGTTFVVNNVFSRTRNNLTDVKLASGEICHALGENWEQNLGTDAYPTPTGSKGVYHSRTVSNHYGTVCLPFAMQSNDKVKLYSMNEVNNGEDDVTIRFSYVENVEAGHPALFCVEEQGDITFESIDDEIIYNPPFPPMLGDWAFVGVFDTRVFSGDLTKTTYYISGDKIRNASVAVHIAPYRAYIFGPSIDKLTSNSTNRAKAIQFTLDDEDGMTTALELVGEDLVPAQHSGKAYSIMGTEVDNNYRGIVIKNGKKVIK